MLRLANINDTQVFLRMARSFHEASPYSRIEFSEDRILSFFLAGLQNPSEIITILSEQDGEVHGMICGLLSSPPFSDQKVATELAWWIDEEYRASKDSILLFRAYEDWAVRVNANLVQMALLSTSPDLLKTYERSGYELVERTFLKEL